ncbi:hypothetical protein P691DRAFT_793844 [Macrolepiota fuliginosa MF-IS2]|uniref:Uncharacterized protein n=1 Tax=Macrolepiota fuliginosa MF-IS2 TaxID=1400762 RepID=A0A9P5X9P0_9AGAR|nr:hypothetical protein P691DRAFT_793844 [Macrolepiota fuliginosa MF-IS2]
MLAYASLVVICQTSLLALNTREMQVAYIDHSNFVGAPAEYISDNLFIQPIGRAESAFSAIIDSLTVGIQIWRLWVIYSATRYAFAIIILPTLLFLCFVVIATQLAITVIVTVLVVARLLRIRRVHINLMGTSDISKQYMSIVAMLVESYALESVWTLAALIALFQNTSAFTFFANCSNVVDVIAYLLVIYRVSTGRGWNRETERQMIRRSTYSTTAETVTPAPQALPATSSIVPNSVPLAHSAV